MRWFQKPQEPDVWEVADNRPLGDIEAAQKIRGICTAASAIADKVAAGGRRAEQGNESERYQAAIKRALEIAMKISDDSMRDVSVSQIIALCMKVDLLKTAKILVRAIKAERTRDELITEYPALRG